MDFQYLKEYDALSEYCSAMMVKIVRDNPKAAIVLATGYSPSGTYKKFVESVTANRVPMNQVTFIKLDEWVGIPSTDPATCQFYIENAILSPLSVPSTQYIAFDGMAADMQAECARIETEINALPAIDLMILGIGKNGHLGLNEPGMELQLSAHCVELSEKSRTHEMLRQAAFPVTSGVTLGIGQIFKAKKVLLIAAGDDKQEAFETLKNGIITPQFPLTILKLHQNCVCVAENSFR